MKKDTKEVKYSLFSIKTYMLFFCLIVFVVTCSIILFVDDMNISHEEILKNTLPTFINIFILSFIITFLSGVYYRLTVERPIRNLLRATKEVKSGNFDTSIEPLHGLEKRNELDIIIDNFNEMIKELSGVETLRNDFISNVSHELKTPLSIIQNYADLMRSDDISDKERIEYSNSIYEASQNLSQLITNILKLNRLENQTLFLETDYYNLSKQLEECILGFESIWESKNIELEIDIEENIGFNMDQELMSIVWNNLLSNAFKFTEPHGIVNIKATQDEKYIYVFIHDTGCGMSNEVGKHIFEKFYQGDTSHATKGNGLGLALVKRIIDIMEAQISVESIPNHGTTFIVSLVKKDT